MDQGLAVTGVSKRFGPAEVLSGVSLHVPPGSLCALLGPSGSGKTTLLRIVAGLERADAGSVVLDGRTLFDQTTFVAPERRELGMVFQDWAVFPHLSVGRNVAFGVARGERPGRVGEVLEMVGLAGFEERMPSTLSGGQLQRVALARALAPRPKMLLLDEPFSNLDVALRVKVRTELHRLLAAAGVTTVFVTHDQEEAFVLGDQVAVMRDGRILQCATPRELYDEPVDAWTAAFVGDVILLDGHQRGTTVDTPLGPVPARTACDGAVRVLVRPESLVLEPGGDARVELTEFYGHDTMVDVRLPDGTLVRARVREGIVGRADRVAVRYGGRPVVTYPVTARDHSEPAGSTAGR